MTENGKTFVLCAAHRKFLTRMTAEQKAALLDALFAYNDGEPVTLEDPVADMVFMIMTDAIEEERKHNDHHRKLDIPLSQWKKLRQMVFKKDHYSCKYCGSTVLLECDHVVPFSRGGRSILNNLATACRHCNRSKHSRTPDEWRGK